jgi:hypothetical protein
LVSGDQHQPIFTGAFREEVPALFDLFFHSGVTKQGKHYLLWKPDPSRPTKSRFGALAKGKMIKADWSGLKEKIAEAVERRKKGTEAEFSKSEEEKEA